jgi:myo-inositol-1(or 4)-monophosphatase
MLRSNHIKFRGAGAVALSLANARNYLFFLLLGSRRVFDIEAGLHICEGLYIYSDNKILFVSAYKDIFDDLLPKIKENIKDNKHICYK